MPRFPFPVQGQWQSSIGFSVLKHSMEDAAQALLCQASIPIRLFVYFGLTSHHVDF